MFMFLPAVGVVTDLKLTTLWPNDYLLPSPAVAILEKLPIKKGPSTLQPS
jgi:hypothetical protein